jgi:hypothetical protein
MQTATRGPLPVVVSLFDYTGAAVRSCDLMEVVDGTAATIKKWMAENASTKITHIVCTGSSGQAVAWPVSYKLGIPVCVVRKEGEKSHAGRITGEGYLGAYIVIDDLIDSGATLERVFDTINAAYEHKASTGLTVEETERPAPHCVAVFLYNEHDWSPFRTGYQTTFRDTKVPVIANQFVA